MTSMHVDGAAHVSERDLRKFGLSTGITFALVLGLLLPWLFSARIPLWPFAIAVALVAPALLFPRVLRPVHYWWMRGAEIVGAFNARVILGIAFYGIVTPMGWIRRLFGSDPLGLRPTAEASFRKPSRLRAPKSMERPF